jgi:fimbrial isopeptide formation D2 family protein/LPXTG-motif cell wall-anchored protein
MKKIRKMLAGLLGAAMVLTSFGTPAWAAPNSPVTTDATIDTTQKGSITIHKYEYNGDGGQTGTGETSDTVPSGAKALADAGFTIYKIADVNDLTNYYSTNPSELPSVDTYVTQDTTTKKWSINAAYETTKVGEEKKTDDQGEVIFDTLELGFYVVVETTSPDKVTEPVKPFIVSLPMTTKDGDKWLYDVNVYPKNSTAYGSVTLVKKGNNTDLLKGVTFVLQKSINSVWTNVTTSEEDGSNLNLTTNADGKITVSGLSQGSYRFIETAINNKLPGYILDGAKTYEFSVGSDKKITYGGNTSASVTIDANNEKPDMKKEVQDRTTKTWKQESDYSVGDYVPYKITIDVPDNITQLKEFSLTDKPTGLEDITDSDFSVKCNDIEIANTDNSVYTLTKNADTKGFTISFVPTAMGNYAGQQIVITYKAKVLETALKTTAGNPNTATLEYSNKILPTNDPQNPNTPENPDEKPAKDKIEDSTVVYTFNIKIEKRAQDKNGDLLGGVVFDLYKAVDTHSVGDITGDEAAAVGLEKTKIWHKISTLTTEATGVNMGYITQSGLANGEYYLVETKTADGYNLLKSPVKVQLNVQYATKWSKENVWSVDSNTGVKTLIKHSENSTTFTAKAEGADKATGSMTQIEKTDKSTEATMTETIINRKGFTLPKTGDIGTAMFLIIGIGGMLAAVYIMLRGRKRA